MQAAWTRYVARRDLVRLRVNMGELYASKGKQRSRGSVYRPFDGEYLPNATDSDVLLRESMMDVIRYQGENERVVFTDWVQRARLGAKGDPVLEPLLLAVTQEAFYLLERVEGAVHGRDAKMASRANKAKQLHLRRRTELDDVMGVDLSKMADDFLLIRCEPDEKRKIGDKSHWVSDSGVTKCMTTGKACTSRGSVSRCLPDQLAERLCHGPLPSCPPSHASASDCRR